MNRQVSSRGAFGWSLEEFLLFSVKGNKMITCTLTYTCV